MEREELLLPVGDPSPATRKKRGHVVVRVLVCSLLMGVSICVLLSPLSFPLSDDGKAEKSPGGSKLSKTNMNGNPEQCDLFTGEWIYDPRGPAYTNESCNFIEAPQNCMKNGRPDTTYLYWRWKPYGCDIPHFNAEKFMNAMRDKSWAMIGDSIFRNHIQSIICLVSKVEQAVEVYHDESFKSKTWYFPSHNFTLSAIWAPLLVEAETTENNEGVSKGPIQLHLDALDKNWTSIYHKYDYVMLSGGQWYTKTMDVWENGKVVGCHGCEDYSQELGLDYTYRKALKLVLGFIATSDHKPLVIYRTWTPSHFEHGQWFSGGICNRTLPYREGEYNGLPSDILMQGIEVEEFEKAAAVGSKNGARMKLLDVFHLSLLRPDGHPGPYRHPYPFANNKTAKVQNDCLHWCLPGPIDIWNDIVMQMLLTEGELRDTI